MAQYFHFLACETEGLRKISLPKVSGTYSLEQEEKKSVEFHNLGKEISSENAL